MIVAQVEDLNVVVELEQVAQLGRVLQTIELVVSQVQLPQVHVHLQSSGWRRQLGALLPGGTVQPLRVRVQDPKNSEAKAASSYPKA